MCQGRSPAAYSPAIRAIDLSDGELAELLASPFAAEELSDPSGLLVTVRPEAGAFVDHRLLTSLPCVVVGVDRPAFDTPPWCDAVVDPAVTTIGAIEATVEATPLAATAFVLLLRSARATVDVEAGLVAESAVYSMLQGGPEFARWRASHPARERAVSDGLPVRVERSGGRVDVILDRPEVRNALDRTLRDGWLAALAVALADPSVSEVVVRGEGPSFCSGGDLDEFGSFGDPASAHLVRLTASIGRALDQLGARLGPGLRFEVHGPCAGSGIELPAFAALVEARSDFTAILPEVRLGLIPGAGGTVSLSRRMGRHRTALLGLSGATLDASTALAWGLVNHVHPPVL